MPKDETQPDADTSEAAYARGDFAALQRAAQRVLNDASADAEARATAQRFANGLKIDAWTWAALSFSMLLFCAIVLRYVL